MASLYDTFVPTLIRGLGTFEHILNQAEVFAKEKGEDVNSYVEARLIPDQLPLAFQVQNATKAAQIAQGRLTGTEPALFENNEKTIAELKARIQKTVEQLKAIDAATVNPRAGQQLDFTVPWNGTVLKYSIEELILSHSFPNFYFHLTTAYSILRAKGVPLGKKDYISSFLAL